MRKALVYMIAVGALTFIAAPAVAGVIKLSGTHTRDEIKTTCEKNGGTFDGIGGAGSDYGCVGKGGSVFCKNDGTCAGVCAKCGSKAAPGKGMIGSILTIAPTGKIHPLTSQKTTRPAARAPAHPLRPQKVTRSPTSGPAQPLTSQNVTRTAPVQRLGSSPTPRKDKR